LQSRYVPRHFPTDAAPITHARPKLSTLHSDAATPLSALPQIHVDSIGLDRTGAVLYYGAVTNHKLYSVRTDDLLRAAGMAGGDPPPPGGEAAARVLLETAEKPVSDGLSTDAAGNVWLTAFALSALAVAAPRAAGHGPPRLVKVVQSESLLRWPDGLCFGPDGLYVTNSALHLHVHSALTGADLRARHGPFHILRLPARALRDVAAALGQPPDGLLPVPGQ
jgi:sugar lactone lactonase YvrE